MFCLWGAQRCTLGQFKPNERIVWWPIGISQPHYKNPLNYRKVPPRSPVRLIFVQKAFCWPYFLGSLFSEGLLFEEILHSQMDWVCQ